MRSYVFNYFFLVFLWFRVKLLYILKMFPNLQSNVLKDFGVTIRGFQAGSTKLFLSGPTQSLDKPSLIITRILNGHNVTTEACIGLLIPSAQTRISLEKLPVVLCASTENGNDFCYAKEFSKRPTKITLSICGPENALLKVKAILKSPKKKELSLANTSVLQKLKESPSCNFPYLLCQYGVYILEHVHTTGCSLTVQGYVEGEVDTAFSILSNAAAKFHSRTYCYSKIFQYECHPNFKFQIQECIVKPLQQQLSMGVSISFLDSDKILPLEKFSGSRGKNTITIVTKSNNSKDFMAACERLKVGYLLDFTTLYKHTCILHLVQHYINVFKLHQLLTFSKIYVYNVLDISAIAIKLLVLDYVEFTVVLVIITVNTYIDI